MEKVNVLVEGESYYSRIVEVDKQDLVNLLNEVYNTNFTKEDLDKDGNSDLLLNRKFRCNGRVRDFFDNSKTIWERECDEVSGDDMDSLLKDLNKETKITSYCMGWLRRISIEELLNKTNELGWGDCMLCECFMFFGVFDSILEIEGEKLFKVDYVSS